MQSVYPVILKIIPVIFMLLLGMWMRRTRFVSAGVMDGIKKITLDIAVPSVLFTTFFRADITQELLALTPVTFAVCLALFGLGFLMKRLSKSTNTYMPALYATFLTGPVGFPLFSAYFGEDSLYKLAILDTGHAIFLFTVIITYMGMLRGKNQGTSHKNIRAALKSMIKSPLTFSMLAGIALSFSGYAPAIESHPVGTAMLSIVDLAAAPAFSLSLLLVGYELPIRASRFGRTLAHVLLRLGIMLAIAYALNTLVIDRWLGLGSTYQVALYTMFLLPPSFIIPLSIPGQGRGKEYVMGFISLHLAVSLAAFIVLMSVIWKN